ncbi:MAG: CAP domain-containing protein [Ktedonobacterales bacterium]
MTTATRRGWLLSAIIAAILVALTASSLFALRATQGAATHTPPGVSASTGASGAAASNADEQLRQAPTVTPSPTVNSSAPPSSGRTSNGCAITSAQANAELYLLNLLNRHRAAAGAPPLTLNQTLSRASRAHSCDMFLHQKLNHLGSDGATPQQRIAATGISYHTWAENIGYTINSGLTNGINRTDAAMMSEPDANYDHHFNIVNLANTQVGLGVIYANGQMWMTEDFIG